MSVVRRENAIRPGRWVGDVVRSLRGRRRPLDPVPARGPGGRAQLFRFHDRISSLVLEREVVEGEEFARVMHEEDARAPLSHPEAAAS
jgi:hypothetical protein